LSPSYVTFPASSVSLPLNAWSSLTTTSFTDIVPVNPSWLLNSRILRAVVAVGVNTPVPPEPPLKNRITRVSCIIVSPFY